MDWATVGLLALLVMLDGWRRVPPDAVALRKPPGAPWRVLPTARDWSRNRLLSWSAPFSLTILLHPESGDPASSLSAADLCRRAAVLRVLGATTALLLIAGVPAASRWLGAAGFLGSAALVLVSSAGTAAAAVALARGAGTGGDRSIGWAVPLVSPFSTARAAEVFLERVLAGRPAAAVARELLDPDAFSIWVRPLAYDHLRGADHPALGMDREALITLTQSRPEPEHGARAFCPRCGESFTDSGIDCPACSVALVAY